jgi:DNA-3-methyladenine glycosylase
MNSNQDKLQKDFYEKDLHKVAKELLGKILIRKLSNICLSGIIVEVEAYDGFNDEASHSFNGKTKRNEVMFNSGGLLYVYFTYGMHFCSNVVVGKVNEGKAVLIRALQPLDGIDEMAFNRFCKKDLSKKDFINLTNGPAKLTMALKIGGDENGINLCSSKIFIRNAPALPADQIVCTTRIGIKKSVDLPWRYYIKDNPFVSKK